MKISNKPFPDPVAERYMLEAYMRWALQAAVREVECRAMGAAVCGRDRKDSHGVMFFGSIWFARLVHVKVR